MQIHTHSGGTANPMLPKNNQLNIEDIAESLAHIFAFNGLTGHGITLAQASVKAYGATKQKSALLFLSPACFLGNIPFVVLESNAGLWKLWLEHFKHICIKFGTLHSKDADIYQYLIEYFSIINSETPADLDQWGVNTAFIKYMEAWNAKT